MGRWTRRNKDRGDGGTTAVTATSTTRPALSVGESDEEWQHIHELLTGLLSVDVDVRFQDEPHHPNASWLVVNVTQVEDPEPQRRHLLATRISDVLSAVATLCASAERLRMAEPQQLAFWTRVLTSQMMQQPLCSGDLAIWWFARHTREREIRIKLRWADRKLEKKLLLPLRSFMDAETAGYVGHGSNVFLPRPMEIALCVTKVQLTAKDMELLGPILAPSESTSSSARRLFRTSLASLEISETLLHVGTLRALAQQVYSVARRIDELRLEAIFPSGPLADPAVTLRREYLSAFRSVLVAALATHSSTTTMITPVGISLAYNALDAAHVRVLDDALRGAGSVLRSLSLKYALLPPRQTTTSSTACLPDDLVMALGRILFVSSHPMCGGYCDQEPGTRSHSCELDLTGQTLQAREVAILRRCLDVLVREKLQLVQQTLNSDTTQTVTCRVVRYAVLFAAPNQDDANNMVAVLELDRDYVVLDTSIRKQATSWLRVRWHHSANDATESGWIPSTSIAQLQIPGRGVDHPLVVPRPRFDRLLLDGDVEKRLAHKVCGCDNASLLALIGSRATRVSMRWYQCHRRHSISDMLATCPRVAHLSLEGSRSWIERDDVTGHNDPSLSRLESLHVGSTRVDGDHIHHLIMELLMHAPYQFRLRRLGLAQNCLSTQTLAQIHTLLNEAPSLELVELNSSGGSSWEMESYTAARRALTRDHEGVVLAATPRVSGPAKLALLSVVATFCPNTALDRSVYDHIFAFSAQATRRHLLWHQHQSS